MAAGSDVKQPASSLLERWRAAGVRPEPPCACPPRPAAPPPAPRADPAALLAALEEAIASALPPAAASTALALLDPIRAAVRAPDGERDPAALTLAFERAEDVLEALLLAPSLRASTEG